MAGGGYDLNSINLNKPGGNKPRRHNQGGGNKNKKVSPLMRRATRDVRLSYRPLLQENERAQAAAESAYGALPGEIKDIYQGYTGASNNIAGNLVDQLGALNSVLPGLGGPTSEQAAFGGAFTDAGQAGLSSLASQAQRNVGYGASARTEAGLAQRAALDNLIQQRQQIMQGFPQDIQARIDELREQRLTQQLARSQMESDEATSRYLMDLIGAQLGSDNKRDRRRRNREKNK